MKYSEAKKAIEALSSKYSVDMDDGNFNIMYKQPNVGVYVDGCRQYELSVCGEEALSKLPFSNKLYMILSELAMTPLDERVEEKKYYVKIFDGGLGYLNIDISTGNMTAGSVCEIDFFKTKFTNKAIEQLKQRDDVSLDWNKVTLEEAE